MRSKIKLVTLIISLVAISSFIQVQATTIDDSSISVEEGQIYNWTYTYASDLVNTSDRVRFTIKSIEKGIYTSENVAILNASFDYFHSYSNSWETVIENEAYLYFNGTTDFIYYTPGTSLVYGWLFALPIPFNLTLIGTYLNATFFSDFTSIIKIGNQLICHVFDDGVTLSFLFNDNGLLLRYDIVELDTTILTLEFTGLSSEQGISFGYTFIPIMAISLIGIILVRKRKMKKL